MAEAVAPVSAPTAAAPPAQPAPPAPTTPPAPPEPAAAHTHRGTRAVQRLVEHAPSTGGLALWVRHADAATGAPPPSGLGVHRAQQANPADGQRAAPAAPTPPAWTDGLTVHYSPAFADLPLPRQAAWVAHEVLHIALRHAPRFQALQARLGQADLQLFNVCADAIVNSALAPLAWLELPPDAVHLERLLAQVLGQQVGSEAALLGWDVERLYRAVDDRRAATATGTPRAAQGQRGGSGGSNDNPPQAGARGASGRAPEPAANSPTMGPTFEDGPRAARTRALARADAADLRPGASSSGAPEDDADAARTWTERLLRAHANDGAQSMLRTLLADLPRTHTPWEQVLRVQLTRALAQQPGLSWSRPARSWLANQGRTAGGQRLPWQPGTSATRPVPRLVVVVDVSGSIEAPLLHRFATEIEALSRRLEAALTLVVGDDRVQQVQTFAPGRSNLRNMAFRGGGGTDFTPLLEEAQTHRPDITVVLTDLDGPARYRPRCPVVWAVPDSHHHAVPPFGRLLVLR